MAKAKRDKIFGNNISQLAAALQSQMEGRQNVSQKDSFNSKLDEAIEELTESTKRSNKVEQLLKLTGENSGGGQNILKQLNEAGIPLSDLIDKNQEQTKTLQQMLNEERKARIESEEKALDMKKENKSTEMDMMMQVMKMNQEQQRQQVESFKEILTDLKDEIKEVKNKGNNSNDNNNPVTNVTKKLINQAVEEKINNKDKNPTESIMEQVQNIQQIQDIFGNNNDINKHELEIDKQLELKRIELEDQRRREESQKQREIEQQKLQRWDSFINSLQQIVPAVVQQVSGNNNQNQAQNNNQNPPGENQVFCRECGQQLNPQEIPENCPNCGAQLLEESPPEESQNEKGQ